MCFDDDDDQLWKEDPQENIRSNEVYCMSVRVCMGVCVGEVEHIAAKVKKCPGVRLVV